MSLQTGYITMERQSETYMQCSCCNQEFSDRRDYRQRTGFLGVFESGKYSKYDLELRNCNCGTTLAIEILKASTFNSILPGYGDIEVPPGLQEGVMSRIRKGN